MSGGWPLAALAAGLALAAAGALLAVRAAPPRLLRENRAGRRVPVVLGLAAIPATLAAFGIVFAAAGGYRLHASDAAALAGVGGLAAVGLVDDLYGAGPRGLGGHLASLVRGRPTTGILKLAAGVGAATAIAWLAGGGVLRVAAGAVLMAVSVNVWNALDVTPGRALKWAVIAIAALLGAVWGRTYALLAAAALGAALAALPLDLRERGMLGDAGSNPIGLVAGMGIFLALPTAGVVAAAAVGLALQAIAETVTISRVIAATPPLAWIDRLGRR